MNLLFIFLLEDDFNILLNYFFDFSNPVIYSIIITFLVYLTINSYMGESFIPQERRYLGDKKALIDKHKKEIQTIISLNPDPTFRISFGGHVMEFNDAAKELMPGIALKNAKIYDFVSDTSLEKANLFAPSGTVEFTHIAGKRTFYGKVISAPDGYYSMVHMHDSTAFFRFEKEYYAMIDALEKEKHAALDRLEGERNRIAQDLHDGVGQILSSTKMRLIKLTAYDNDPTLMEIYLRTMNLLSAGIDELKYVTFHLRPKILDELGLAAASKDMLALISDKNRFGILFEHWGKFDNIDDRLELAVYRIIQELATNSMKHSQGTYCNIQLLNKKNMIKIFLYDNGTGFDFDQALKSAEKKHHMGLAGIVERITLFNGTYMFKNLYSWGTYAEIFIPLRLKQL